MPGFEKIAAGEERSPSKLARPNTTSQDPEKRNSNCSKNSNDKILSSKKDESVKLKSQKLNNLPESSRKIAWLGARTERSLKGPSVKESDVISAKGSLKALEKMKNRCERDRKRAWWYK
ncbi:19489_t:CDS:2, partial [Dentiscutata erythropus]